MIKENIARLKSRIPSGVTLVAVSKARSIGEIRQAMEADITDIGENRVQEAVMKYDAIRNALNDEQPKWHMVGHLQTNKVKEAVRIFDLIQSVDSLRLAGEIAKQAAGINKIQDILIEVKTSPEAAKFGLGPDETIAVIKEIAGLKNINIKGLMTIAPIVASPEKARPYFRQLRNLRDEISGLGVWGSEPGVLSMGMTDDFEVAIEEGSTMVRIGRAIFEG